MKAAIPVPSARSVAQAAAAPLLEVDNLSFSYPEAKRRALDRIAFAMPEGAYYVVCGQSGCGKTTLLRHVKRELTPAGAHGGGEIRYRGVPFSRLGADTTSMEIGFVQQNPDNQIVTDYVWHELAFGLENMALPTPVIRRRVAEMASFFGIDSWFRKSVQELSGGQKQMMNLASIMAMNPRLLILDEPTSMLDPIAARNLLDAVRRINRELGVAVLLTEHRLDDVFPVADRVLVLESGRLRSNLKPEQTAAELTGRREQRLYHSLPAVVRIFGELGMTDRVPLEVRDARLALDEMLPPGRCEEQKPPCKAEKNSPVVLQARELWFRYGAEEADVLRGAEFALRKGELACLLGGNGAGKTTMLEVMAELHPPLRGKVKKAKGTVVAMLPQHPQALFTHDTLWEDLLDSAGGGQSAGDWAARLELERLYSRHPYDLSGGEMQRAAICKLLLSNADILLLDEPTKGLDAYMKRELGLLLRQLAESGISLLLVTHDIEFAADYATRCAMLFDGRIVSEDTPRAFFAGNRFYTTIANHIAREHFPNAVTCEEVVTCCCASFTASGQPPPLA